MAAWNDTLTIPVGLSLAPHAALEPRWEPLPAPVAGQWIVPPEESAEFSPVVYRYGHAADLMAMAARG